MRVLLDTNILIHREASRVINEDIGILFHWFDRLNYEKCIHPLSIHEIQKHKDDTVVNTIKTKIKNYTLLKTVAPESDEIIAIREKFDSSENDDIDTSLLKEVFAGRVQFLITEDRNIHTKATELGVDSRIFSIDSFLEKVSSEYPDLVEYKTLSVRKEYFGNIDINDQFFESFQEDYEGFSNWFNKKSDEVAYICTSDEHKILAFLYLKVESSDESYRDISPLLQPKKRLKIGTFKVISNGFKLGERFLKIVFDNALANHVDEVYVTIFNKNEGQDRLSGLLTDWGFYHHGIKDTSTGNENVYVKNFYPAPNLLNPKQTYPFIDKKRRYFLVAIYPAYHTELLPDSILNNESSDDYIENEPHRNAIQKVYVSRAYRKDLRAGDIIIFYRTKTPGTSAYYSSVITTIGVVDNVVTNIANENDFISLCRKRSVFTDNELKKHWNYSTSKPFIVNFLYLHSFPTRPNLKTLIDIGVIRNTSSAPRGFEEINRQQFDSILGASNTNGSYIVD